MTRDDATNGRAATAPVTVIELGALACAPWTPLAVSIRCVDLVGDARRVVGGCLEAQRSAAEAEVGAALEAIFEARNAESRGAESGDGARRRSSANSRTPPWRTL